MPLTTRHRDGRRLDSTDDQTWAEVHKQRYEGLFCPECDYAMHAVAGTRLRIRHFAHNPGRDATDRCTFGAGESPEHLRTKALIADAVRHLDGWSAEIEAPGDGWRADVLAIGPRADELGIRRIAFEPQFSYETRDVWVSAHQVSPEPEGGDPKSPWWPARRLDVEDFIQGDTMLDATDEALALTVPCPKTACAAFCGERCVSYATGRALDIPHGERVEEARKYASGNTGVDR